MGYKDQETQVRIIWKIDKHKNKFGIGWYLGSNLLNGTDTSALPKIKKLTYMITPSLNMTYSKQQ